MTPRTMRSPMPEVEFLSQFLLYEYELDCWPPGLNHPPPPLEPWLFLCWPSFVNSKVYSRPQDPSK